MRAAQIAGLLYVGRNMAQVLSSFPVGMAADRFGARPVLVVGYALGATTATLTALAFFFNVESIALLACIFVVAGLYMAVQEALESTVTAGMVAEDMLGTSLGALGTVNGTAKFISSATVGVLWTAVSPVFSFGLASVLMVLGTFLLYRLRTDSRN